MKSKKKRMAVSPKAMTIAVTSDELESLRFISAGKGKGAIVLTADDLEALQNIATGFGALMEAHDAHPCTGEAIDYVAKSPNRDFSDFYSGIYERVSKLHDSGGTR